NPNGSTVFETLAASATALDSFTYTVTDNHHQSTTGTVDVTVSETDAGPTATGVHTSTNHDSSITGSLASSERFAVSGEPGRAISFTAQTITTADGAIVTIPTHRSYTYNPNGSTVFETLSFGNTMTDSFTYTVTDNHAQSTTGTVSVTVSQPDHA